MRGMQVTHVGMIGLQFEFSNQNEIFEASGKFQEFMNFNFLFWKLFQADTKYSYVNIVKC
jgi:hypothetical protein